jgi:predicted outer membrane protein
MFSSKPSFLKTVFIVILTVTISSCNENEKPEKVKSKYVLTNNTEEIEAYFFVETAGITKSIISKAKLAQHKSLQKSIKIVSTQIEKNQYLLLQEINKIASQKLIIINEINALVTNKELYGLVSKKEVDFDKEYLNSITNSLSEMIKLFESVAKETNDTVILKLVAHYLPKQYEFLRETEKIKKQIN